MRAWPDISFHCFIIHFYESKSRPEAPYFRELEIIKQRPVKISANINPFSNRFMCPKQMLLNEISPLFILRIGNTICT